MLIDADEVTQLRARLDEAEGMISRLYHGNDSIADFRKKAEKFIRERQRHLGIPRLLEVVLPLTLSKRTVAAIRKWAESDGVSVDEMAETFMKNGLHNRAQQTRRVRNRDWIAEEEHQARLARRQRIAA